MNDIDGEGAHLDFSSEVASNQCLNLLQKANENYHAKRALVDEFCFLGRENMIPVIPMTSSFWEASKSQYGENGCLPNATTECKLALPDYFHSLWDKVIDDDLNKCSNTSMIGTSPRYRENDFLFWRVIAGTSKSKDYLETSIDIVTKSCQ